MANMTKTTKILIIIAVWVIVLAAFCVINFIVIDLFNTNPWWLSIVNTVAGAILYGWSVRFNKKE